MDNITDKNWSDIFNGLDHADGALIDDIVKMYREMDVSSVEVVQDLLLLPITPAPHDVNSFILNSDKLMQERASLHPFC